MRYLTLGEVVELHRAILVGSGGAPGIRDLGALESALAQPRLSFDDVDLHLSLPAKTAALESFLLLNGFEIVASIDDQERLMLDLAAGHITREQLSAWIEGHLQPAR